MIRFLIGLLCALGLALAPVTAEAAAMAGSMPGCTMGKKMPAKSTDHGKMDCCTPACQVTAAPALLPHSTDTAADDQASAAIFAKAAAKELASLVGTGLDPPPRG